MPQDERSPEEIIRDACPRAKAGLVTVLVKDCEWCAAAEKAVAVAVAAERERCAKILEDQLENHRKSTGHKNDGPNRTVFCEAWGCMGLQNFIDKIREGL